MTDYVKELFLSLLRPTTESLSIAQMSLRAALIYLLTLLFIRLGKRRFLARPTPFDVILWLVFGSVISRSINGNAPLLPTIGAAAVLIMLHFMFSILSYYSSRIGALVKGMPVVLIKEGEIQWNAMKKHGITEHDLLGALRRNAQIISPREVVLAMLERSGEISVIPFKNEPSCIHTFKD